MVEKWKPSEMLRRAMKWQQRRQLEIQEAPRPKWDKKDSV